MERLLGQVLLLTQRDTFLHEAGDRIGPPDDKLNERSCLSMNSSFFGVKVAENGRYVQSRCLQGCQETLLTTSINAAAKA